MSGRAERDLIDSSIAAVHDEITQTIQSADANVSVRSTGYFNHTYAPDLVLTWNRDRSERHVYVRASDSADYLAEDIELAKDADPIFVPLGGLVFTHDADHTPAGLVERSRAARALVADSRSIAALAEGASGQPVSAIAARAVLQGGSGLIDAVSARSYGESVAAGFEGALLGDIDSTNAALRSSLELLDTARSAQLAELLQAAWIGGGQSATSFPGIGIAGSSLEPEALRLLLDTVNVDDMAFWDRLSRGLQLAHFEGLSVSEEHEGFQMLMRAAAPRLTAKAARAVSIDSQRLRGARWALQNGRLMLAFAGNRLEFVARSIDDFVDDGEPAVPSVRTFVRRAQRADLDVTRVTLSSDDRRLEYASEDGTSVTNDDRLVALEGDLGPGATVVRAAIATSDRELTVNLSNSTASGHTRAIFAVSTLAQTTLPLVTDLSELDRDGLAALFDESE